MATISSPGIGSGLDVQSIVSQLVTLEKAPLNSCRPALRSRRGSPHGPSL
jgi:flagellar capping protein FliD